MKSNTSRYSNNCSNNYNYAFIHIYATLRTDSSLEGQFMSEMKNVFTIDAKAPSYLTSKK